MMDHRRMLARKYTDSMAGNREYGEYTYIIECIVGAIVNAR